MDNRSYSKGISWIDDCRIPFVDEGDSDKACKSDRTTKTRYQEWNRNLYNRLGGDTKGRFPANLLVSDDMLNDGVITKQTKWNKIHDDSIGGIFGGGRMNPNNSYGDKGSNSRYYDIDKWFNNLIDV